MASKTRGSTAVVAWLSRYTGSLSTICFILVRLLQRVQQRVHTHCLVTKEPAIRGWVFQMGRNFSSGEQTTTRRLRCDQNKGNRISRSAEGIAPGNEA